MVVITEITDPDVQTVSGSWAIGADGSWVFIPNPQNAATQPQGSQVGESSSNFHQILLGANVERAFVIAFTGSEDSDSTDVDEVEASDLVEADLLVNLGMPAINLSGKMNVSDNEYDDNAEEQTIRECNFFGPSANYMSGPLGEHLDLEVSLHEALEDICIGMELALRDLQYEGDELFVGRVFKIKQDCKKLLTLTCVSESCPWRVYIVKLEDSNNYQIRRATLEHTCIVEERSNYHRAATTRVIGSIMKGKYEGNTRGPRAIDLQRLLLTDHSVRISYWKAWKFREIAIEGAKGSAANSFSLLPAYIHVFPKARYGACVVHLQRNIAAAYKKKHLLFHVSRAARAFRICEFHTYFNEVIRLDSACARYLDVKEARELPIISLIEFIRTTLMSWFAMRREAARSETFALPPKMREVVHQNFEKSVRFSVRRIDRYDYEIRGEGSSVYHVKLLECTCSCRAFDLLHLPCPHAIAAAVGEGVPIQGLMAPEYSVETWRMSYQGTIKLAPDVGDVFPLPELVAFLQLFPPATRRPPGRPKKKYITSRGEYQNDSFTRFGGQMREYRQHPVYMMIGGLFRTQFEKALETNNPEAHYLEGLRYACWKKDIAIAKKHIFKAVNIVPKATFVLAMLSICAGEKELGEFFTDQLFAQPWAEVLGMDDSIFAHLERMNVRNSTAYAQTWNGAIPECSEIHNIYNRCEECYIFRCSKEFCRVVR
ncbi:unnamed protein product [Arabidopsis arenosa]|uniref:SWIM-type domain-containing protein n=1 Tax=Arabidopsis arenosa TaxID=38785 RepID=A0A8S2B4A8_ARAAE|nr:unnamed protein product [Arabidopsis arenosa]